MYEVEFREAKSRSERFGLYTPDILFTTDKYLNEKAKNGLQQFIQEKIGIFKEDELVLQCLSIHLQLKPVLSEYFNCPAYYTIGYVEIHGDAMFEQTEDSLKQMLVNGIGLSINQHRFH